MSWEWKDKTKWESYDCETSATIEKAYINYKKHSGPSSFSFQASFSDDTYTIDFHLNKQINERTKFYRFIRRNNNSKQATTNTENNKKAYNNNAGVGRKVPTGIKAITSLLLPKEVWHVNDIANLRFVGTDGLPPKISAPHITLLDSFSSDDRFEQIAELFKFAASRIEPFDITIKKFSYFTHGTKRGFTIYLEPEVISNDKSNPLIKLQKLLYDEVNKSGSPWLESKMPPNKFLPHVSLGKISTKQKLDETIAALQPKWEPITFTVRQIYIMSKLTHDTVVRHIIPLGFQPSPSHDFLEVPFPTDGTYSININWIPEGASEGDVLDAFAPFSPLRASVVFKTIDLKEFTKGWGNVVFKDKDSRDAALSEKILVKGREVEIFPCD